MKKHKRKKQTIRIRENDQTDRHRSRRKQVKRNEVILRSRRKCVSHDKKDKDLVENRKTVE